MNCNEPIKNTMQILQAQYLHKTLADIKHILGNYQQIPNFTEPHFNNKYSTLATM